ncbi:MAG: protein phosphatase 2C family protein [Bacteroides sp.]|nr:protein phosphatase 2C family protein [Bacteroides sp.]
MKPKKFNTVSIAGKGKTNEDYILCRDLSEEWSLAILADGMGGLSYGNEAAKIVSCGIADFIAQNLQVYEPQEILRKAFDRADALIRQKCYELRCKMGAAVCVSLIGMDSIHYAWQGNVRLYKKDNDNLQLLTTDHIAVGGNTTLLIRCINGKGFREPIPVESVSVNDGSTIFMCSDGYYQGTNNMQSQLLTDLNDDASVIQITLE